MIKKEKFKIGIVGLGYVGLPLAVEFAKKYKTVGFDINPERVNNINNFKDVTLEVSKENLKKVIVKTKDKNGLYCSIDSEDLRNCNFFIITVPTPTDINKRPDLTPLIKASEVVAKYLKKNDYVVYESTVYPGVTEEECIPVLERDSQLKLNNDFFVGYSPERINPGDKQRTVAKILKVTSGSTLASAKVIDNIYKTVITAGTFLASSIKVAEASKVIENSQRDINIAFVNELAKIFSRLNIDTKSVLEAAGTKWNFLPFKPGLVGGHCIGVDPYYLAQKAEQSGYYPEIILAGRRINDSMGVFVSSEIIKEMVKKDIPIKNSNALILGFTFKENCPDYRNTRVIDIYNELSNFGLNITVYDPWLEPSEIENNYNINIFNKEDSIIGKKFDTIILAVGHELFKELDIHSLRAAKSIVYDIKGFLPIKDVDSRL